MSDANEIDVITLELAEKGLKAAERFARDIIGWASSIAVVDAGGTVIAVHRMDGAPQATLDIAIEKAWTGATFRAPTLMLGRMTDPRTAMMPLDQLPLGQHGMGLAARHKGRLCNIMGGIPIRDKDMEVIGAVGTSGTPSASDDNTISQKAWSAMYDLEEPSHGRSDNSESRRRGPVRAASETLSLDFAAQLIEAAIDRASELGTLGSVAVADEHGWLIALHRMDGAPMATVEIARDKAWTAAAFKMRSARIDGYGNKELPGYGFSTANWNERVCPIPGGLPIESAGRIIGAIGVSGSTPTTDERIAKHVLRQCL